MEIIKSEEQKEKILKTSKQNLTELLDTNQEEKHTHCERPREERKGQREYLRK